MGRIGSLEFALIGFVLLLIFIPIISLGKIFTKAGRPMWNAFVPVYNYYALINIVGRPDWWILLFIAGIVIPDFGSLITMIVLLVLMIDLAKVFGKSTLHGVGLFFLAPIMLPMLAYGDAQYLGLPGETEDEGADDE